MVHRLQEDYRTENGLVYVTDTTRLFDKVQMSQVGTRICMIILLQRSKAG